ncbi:hypothetical protein GCU67_04235 [Modestobacter muralis]|uniref:Uncharacterized protein n=1 Tax=Modestobacter muralis TaxID=1608614 RepID=A0A6P0ESC0_9ACTN|nr:hypothetical protein [Modestobacter muralis]
MRAARVLALLILAAVFSMHGLQCLSAQPAGTNPGDHTTTAAMGASPSGDAHLMAAGSADAAPAAMGDPGSSASHPGPVHSAAHALAVCLAVLLAGLALLAAVLSLRRATAPDRRDAALVRARSWWASIQLPRPPDLAVLCLLRI